MGKLLIRALVLLLLVAPAAAALADSLPKGIWWRDPAIARQLRRTPGEVQQLDRLYDESRRRMIDLKGTVEQAQRSYQQLMERRNLDEPAVRRQGQQLEQSRSRLANERSHFMLEVRKILGHERFQELKSIYERSR